MPRCKVSGRDRNTLDVLELYGAGFSPTGGNVVGLVSGNQQQQLNQTDGYYYWDGSRGQINVQIGRYIVPGTYSLSVLSPNSGAAASSTVSTVDANSACN